MPITWSDVAGEFAPNGSLRDVVVRETSLADWDAVLRHLGAQYGPLSFAIDGEASPAPESAAEAFAVRNEASPSFSFTVGGVQFACHFFTPDEIEFDFLPEQVSGPAPLAALCGLLGSLARVTGKEAVVTEESAPELVILRAAPPEGTVVYVPPSDPLSNRGDG